MNVFSKTDIGRKRECNEDFCRTAKFSDSIAFAVICDGMGGANAGDIASYIAANRIFEYVENSVSANMTPSAAEKMLRSAVITANMDVFEKSTSDENLNGMGTTVVAALVIGNIVCVVHVGDSRAYCFSKGELKQITVDHSVVQSMVEKGEITPDEAKHHPQKNIITRALGVDNDLNVDYNEFSAENGDTVLICTDGLTNYVNDADICKILEQRGNACSEKLVALANENGGGDNITVAIIEL